MGARCPVPFSVPHLQPPFPRASCPTGSRHNGQATLAASLGHPRPSRGGCTHLRAAPAPRCSPLGGPPAPHRATGTPRSRAALGHCKHLPTPPRGRPTAAGRARLTSPLAARHPLHGKGTTPAPRPLGWSRHGIARSVLSFLHRPGPPQQDLGAKAMLPAWGCPAPLAPPSSGGSSLQPRAPPCSRCCPQRPVPASPPSLAARLHT